MVFFSSGWATVLVFGFWQGVCFKWGRALFFPQVLHRDLKLSRWLSVSFWSWPSFPKNWLCGSYRHCYFSWLRTHRPLIFALIILWTVAGALCQEPSQALWDKQYPWAKLQSWKTVTTLFPPCPWGKSPFPGRITSQKPLFRGPHYWGGISAHEFGST